MLNQGLAPKTVRNTMTFLSSVFSLAVREGWRVGKPVTHAARPKRRCAGDANPDLQFLTLSELERVLGAIPGQTTPGHVPRVGVRAGRTEPR